MFKFTELYKNEPKEIHCSKCDIIIIKIKEMYEEYSHIYCKSCYNKRKLEEKKKKEKYLSYPHL